MDGFFTREGKPVSVKYIDIKEFVDEGYLQELNRQFLHPLGLALEVTVHSVEGYRLSGVWDCRDDPTGIMYTDGVLEPKKAENIAKITDELRPIREKGAGFWVQPLPPTDKK